MAERHSVAFPRLDAYCHSARSDEVLTIFQLHLADVFADKGRGIAFLANEQHVALFGNDTAFKPVDHRQMVLGHLDDVAAAVFGNHVGADHHIVVLALAHTLVDGMPHAQVGPSEVAPHHADVLVVVKQSEIYRQIGIRGEILLNKEQFILDNQEAFRYGAIEEFGLRYEHYEEDGEIMFRFEKMV